MRTDFGLYQIGANSSPLSFAIGGLRCDPFDAFPIGAKDGVPEAVDYCKTKAPRLICRLPKRGD